MYILVIFALFVVGVIQEWNLTALVYEWLSRETSASSALFSILLSFFLSATLGAKLFRQVGTKILLKVQKQLAAGQAPDQALAEGLLVVIAALLLIAPGYLSDALGLLILLLRKPLALGIIKSVRKNMVNGRVHVVYGNHQTPAQDAPVVIDVEAVETDANAKRLT